MKRFLISLSCAFSLALVGGLAAGFNQAAYAGNPNCVSPAYGCASSLGVYAPNANEAPSCPYSPGYYKIKFTAVACNTNVLPDTVTASRAHEGGAFETVTLNRVGSTTSYVGYTDCVIGPSGGHDYYGSYWTLSGSGSTTFSSFCAQLVCCDGTE